jgi:hypothetical protein
VGELRTVTPENHVSKRKHVGTILAKLYNNVVCGSIDKM